MFASRLSFSRSFIRFSLHRPKHSLWATPLLKHASAIKTIVIREEELDRCKSEAANATAEAESLKKKLRALETQCDRLRQERKLESEMLKQELARELEGQARITESLTQERYREWRRVEDLEDKLK